MSSDLLVFRPEGIYCPPADVYIDPWRKVPKALISHAHSDHARYGMGSYLAHAKSEGILRHRLGKDINLQTINYGQSVRIRGVNFSFHPAGHIVGACQIRVAYKGEVWVFTGDFKREADGFADAFEPVPCHTLIMESTFGLPVYQWQAQEEVYQQINAWWRKTREQGKSAVLLGYSLGKAQRILNALDMSIGPVYAHGAIAGTHQVLRAAGFSLPETLPLVGKEKPLPGAMVLAPPAAAGSPWMRKFEPYTLAMASGWMALRGARRRGANDRGFVLSDHADWPALNQTVQDSGAQRIIVTHGYTDAFARWLREKGYDAQAAKTDFQGETETDGAEL